MKQNIQILPVLFPDKELQTHLRQCDMYALERLQQFAAQLFEYKSLQLHVPAHH